MPGHEYNIIHNRVALRKESVDRNVSMKIDTGNNTVALRKESVDRNITIITICTVSRVALRKESVDRNRHFCDDVPD